MHEADEYSEAPTNSPAHPAGNQQQQQQQINNCKEAAKLDGSCSNNSQIGPANITPV
ncbi:GD22505 [Drosophila simulans]|uniref:GD22505 n=3 Tax=Drosophila simulans TaxID=7240 RepID=B4Q5D6_DROSI|nr:GD22505 [Drosophila simulans]